MYLKFDIFRNRKDSVQMIPTEILFYDTTSDLLELMGLMGKVRISPPMFAIHLYYKNKLPAHLTIK